jgi:hypothetical protein
MNVVIVRDVVASSQVELFFPDDALVLEMKASISESFPNNPSKDTLKLVYCGKILSDFDMLGDVLAWGRNSLSTPIIHAIINSMPGDTPTGGGESSAGASGESVDSVAGEEICFDPVSLEFARNEMAQNESSRSSRQRAHVESVLLYAAKSAGSVAGGAGPADDAVGREAPIPPPRWLDVKLMVRLAISVALFGRHWAEEKLYCAVVGCVLYYFLDTGVFRYLYRRLARWSKRREHGRAPAPAALPTAAGADTGAAPVVKVGVVEGVQQWLIGGFYIPENPPPPPEADGGPLPPLADRALTFVVDWGSLLVGFVLCLFPSWSVDGMDIPW